MTVARELAAASVVALFVVMLVIPGATAEALLGLLTIGSAGAAVIR